VNLDGALTNTQIISNDFVRLARDNEVKYFALAICEACKSLSNFGMRLLFLTSFLIGFQRLVNPVKQVLVAEWLLNEIDSTFLHGVDGHWHVAVPGNEYDWQAAVAPNQFFLQLQTAETWHTDIEYEATRTLFRRAFEELVT
jgi:hypothetical protein